MATIALWFTLFLYVGSGCVSKLLTLSALDELFWRDLIAAVLLYLYSRRTAGETYSKREWFITCARSIFGYLISAGSFFFALNSESLATVGFLSCLPLLPLWELLLFRTTLSRVELFQFAFSIVGLFVFFGSPQVNLTAGTVSAFIAAASFNLSIALRGYYRPGRSAVVIARRSTLMALILQVILLPCPAHLPSPESWLPLLLGGSSFAFAGTLVSFVYGRLSATRISLTFSLEPLFTAGAGFLFFSENISSSQLIGGALLMGSLVLGEDLFRFLKVKPVQLS